VAACRPSITDGETVGVGGFDEDEGVALGVVADDETAGVVVGTGRRGAACPEQPLKTSSATAAATMRSARRAVTRSRPHRSMEI
jgi:hypothetical protein